MERHKKASVMATAAMVASALGTQATAAGAAEPARSSAADALGGGEPDPGQDPDQDGKKKPVKKVKKAKKRPVERDPDLSMPAGTAYDVIDRGDIV